MAPWFKEPSSLPRGWLLLVGAAVVGLTVWLMTLSYESEPVAIEVTTGSVTWVAADGSSVCVRTNQDPDETDGTCYAVIQDPRMPPTVGDTVNLVAGYVPLKPNSPVRSNSIIVLEIVGD